MRLGAALAVVAVALALPMYAQHGGARGGYSGHAGYGGHAGFSGHAGFTGGSKVSRPVPYSGQARFARPAFGRLAGPGFAGTRGPYRGSGLARRRPLYRPTYGDRSGSWNRARRRGPWIAGANGYGYPGWGGYPYPYVIDPGFYDWGDSGDSDYGSGYAGGANQGYADLVPYPSSGDAPEPPQEPLNTWQQSSPARPQYAGSTATSEAPPLQPLTVIFKNGRAPETMQNFMVNSRALTDLDQQHYEQIPLDQIDLVATEQANRVRGLDFQVPAGSR
jgi:hypothetical protein